MVKVRKGCAQRTHADAWLFCKGDPHATSEGHALLTELPSGDVMDGFEDWFAAEIKGWFGPTDFEDELSDTHASAKAGWFAARGGKP